jgi:hypothetical protein
LRSRRIIPRLPPVAGASKPPGWDRWSPAEKVQHLLGVSLDRMHEYLSWRADGLDPYRLAPQSQVIRVLAMVAAKAGIRQADSDGGDPFSAGYAGRQADRRLTSGSGRKPARLYGENRAGRGGGLEKLDRPRKLQPIFRESPPRRCGRVCSKGLGETADVGCGHGWSTVLMAKAFPRSQFIGYDFHPRLTLWPIHKSTFARNGTG